MEAVKMMGDLGKESVGVQNMPLAVTMQRR
jgi:hypothetical protein